MTTHTLRDLDDARTFLQQGLWLQRVQPPTPATVRPALEWALEAASAGQPLPPVGFVADLGHVAFGLDWAPHAAGLRSQPGGPPDAVSLPHWPHGLSRAYEDHVLGKLYADWTFSRARDVLCRYQGRDRARGLAFVLNQFRHRAGFAGAEFSPGVIKSLIEMRPEEVLAKGWESLQRDGPLAVLAELYEGLIAASRRCAEVLAPEDVFELEHGTALRPEGDRVALRQVLQAAARLEAALPRHRPRPPSHRQEVPTRVLDEDTYPVGGFSSLSNRGSMESLLHSQLACMEKGERPDLFDVKFLRDELLYYARDENQFRRRRRTFALLLAADLTHARFKDAELPWQRGVLLLGLLVVLVRKLSEWLSTDALTFTFYLPAQCEKAPLAPERLLLETIFREQIANRTVGLARFAQPEEVAKECGQQARRSLCHALIASAAAAAFHAEDTAVTRLQVAGPYPALGFGDEPPSLPEANEPVEAWHAALRQVLERWVY